MFPSSIEEIVGILKSLADRRNVERMMHYGITSKKAEILGVPKPN